MAIAENTGGKMRKKLLVIGLAVAALLTGSGLAVGAETLTKDEVFLQMAIRLRILNALYTPTRKQSIAGQWTVVPILKIVLTDSQGQALDDADLPPALANLQADLSNTDIVGEFEEAGFKVLRNDQVTLAPRFAIIVSSSRALDEPNLKTRKMYSVTGVVLQAMTVGMGFLGKREFVVTGTYTIPPILSTLDDESDAENIRVAVRKVVDQYIAEAGVSVHKHHHRKDF